MNIINTSNKSNPCNYPTLYRYNTKVIKILRERPVISTSREQHIQCHLARSYF